MLFSPFTVKALVRLEFILILVLNVCSKQIEMRGQTAILYDKCNDGGCSNMRSFFLGLKVNWFDTLTVKQWEIMINNHVLLFLRLMRKHLTSSSYITVFFFFTTLKITHSVFLVLFSLSNENRFDYTFWHSSFCRY